MRSGGRSMPEAASQRRAGGKARTAGLACVRPCGLDPESRRASRSRHSATRATCASARARRSGGCAREPASTTCTYRAERGLAWEAGTRLLGARGWYGGRPVSPVLKCSNGMVAGGLATI